MSTSERIAARLEQARLEAGVRDAWLDVGAARAANEAGAPPLPEDACVEQIRIGEASCRWVTTPGASRDIRVVYCHGGGFVAGGFRSHGALAAGLSRAARASVLFVEYPLAPEARFPTALKQCGDAVAAAFESGPLQTCGRGDVFVAGDSAGAALALGTLLAARDRAALMPLGAFFLCGLFDLDERTSSHLQRAQRNRDAVRLYVERLDDLCDPLASPLLADLSRLPPLFLQSSESDPLRDDGERLAARAERAGTAVTRTIWPSLPHVWQRFHPELAEAVSALEQVAVWMDDIRLHAKR